MLPISRYILYIHSLHMCMRNFRSNFLLFSVCLSVSLFPEWKRARTICPTMRNTKDSSNAPKQMLIMMCLHSRGDDRLVVYIWVAEVIPGTTKNHNEASPLFAAKSHSYLKSYIFTFSLIDPTLPSPRCSCSRSATNHHAQSRGFHLQPRWSRA